MLIIVLNSFKNHFYEGVYDQFLFYTGKIIGESQESNSSVNSRFIRCSIFIDE